jgi:hypothetical protein
VSRSRKRPIAGITTATNDRDWKRWGHRRDRQQERAALHHGEDVPDRRTVMDVWNSDKDGKAWRVGAQWVRK